MARNLLTTLQDAINIDRRQREIERAHARELSERARVRRMSTYSTDPPQPLKSCEETTGMIGDRYLRCANEAVVIIKHRGRNEGPYAMCFECADHNLRNRNAGVVEWLDKELEAQTKGRYRPL